MAKHKRRRRSGRGTRPDGRSERPERFFMLKYDMALSRAWHSLSGAAVKVFIELRCSFDGANNGKLFLSFADAARRLGLGKSTVKRAFDELAAKGFIRKTGAGNWYGRKAATWRVTTESWQDNLPSHEWRRWQPMQQGENQSLGTEAAREPP